jgi:hypothetical protein
MIGSKDALERTRRMRCVCAEIDDCLSVAQDNGAPLIAFPAGELPGVISRNTDRPEVAAVDIATIGIE